MELNFGAMEVEKTVVERETEKLNYLHVFSFWKMWDRYPYLFLHVYRSEKLRQMELIILLNTEKSLLNLGFFKKNSKLMII